MAYQDDVAHEDAAGRCPAGHRLADWYDDDGKELRTPPYWVDGVQCDACELLEEWREGQGDVPDKGIFPVFRPSDVAAED